MAINPLVPLDRIFLNMHFNPQTYIPGKKKDEEYQGFREMLKQKKQDFAQGKIPYQRILRGRGWVYKM